MSHIIHCTVCALICRVKCVHFSALICNIVLLTTNNPCNVHINYYMKVVKGFEQVKKTAQL